MGMWNNIFWAVFILILISLIATVLTGFLYVYMFFGLFTIIVGIQMLSLEFQERRIKNRQEELRVAINRVIRWVNQNYRQEKPKDRVSELTEKKKELLNEVENRNRLIIKKMLELENKLNEVSKAFASKETVRSGKGDNRIIKSGEKGETVYVHEEELI
ncbi:MAG: hypothetical protein ISS36_00275 [Candidatus Aenigmarchaeota archaeon]|nr:hypothetical protein [Candidatus Aenigmarchaeota archaeon]